MHLEPRNEFWRRMATRRRVLVGAVTVLSLLLLALAHPSSRETLRDGLGQGQVSSSKYPTSIVAEKDGLEYFLGPLKSDGYEDGFTIVSPTFNRSSILPIFFDNYASGNVPSLRRVVMVWNDAEPPSPTLLASLSQYPVPIVIEQRHINSKNQRFRVSTNMRTAAILAIDDDMRFAPADVEFAYQAWRELGQGRRRMVGFVAREAGADGEYLIDQPLLDATTYSMVLTKAAFIHIDWMHGWWADTDEMRSLRDYVDSRKLPEKYPDLKTNCEDILMSFLYARHSRLAPLLFKAPSQDDGLVEGISAKPGHYEARSECVRHLKSVMGEDALVSTSVVIDRYTGPF